MRGIWEGLPGQLRGLRLPGLGFRICVRSLRGLSGLALDPQPENVFQGKGVFVLRRKNSWVSTLNRLVSAWGSGHSTTETHAPSV